MGQELIRLLRAEEIEYRVSAINEKGLSLLLYKDARVDQRILDETFGAFGWKRSHQCIDGNLYCTVKILDRESGEWVAKQDVGTKGYAEKQKTRASDSFQRACFNWGVGRELYSAPFIWIPAAKAGIQKKGDKYVSSERFTVSEISYNDSSNSSTPPRIKTQNPPICTMAGNQPPESRGPRKGTKGPACQKRWRHSFTVTGWLPTTGSVRSLIPSLVTAWIFQKGAFIISAGLSAVNAARHAVL